MQVLFQQIYLLVLPGIHSVNGKTFSGSLYMECYNEFT